MVDLDDKIICMQHCSSERNIFFFVFPVNCPVCGVDLGKCRLLIPPFRVPSPFVIGHQSPCCVLIKPTLGEFLSNFKNGDNLHIGITDSNGHVYNYDERGLCVDNTNWRQCVPLNLTCTSLEWDAILKSTLSTQDWSPERYEENTHNCYDYVLFVLKHLHSFQNCDKKSFCHEFILPLTIKVAKYLELHRKLKLTGIAVQHVLT